MHDERMTSSEKVTSHGYKSGQQREKEVVRKKNT